MTADTALWLENRRERRSTIFYQSKFTDHSFNCFYI